MDHIIDLWEFIIKSFSFEDDVISILTHSYNSLEKVSKKNRLIKGLNDLNILHTITLSKEPQLSLLQFLINIGLDLYKTNEDNETAFTLGLNQRTQYSIDDHRYKVITGNLFLLFSNMVLKSCVNPCIETNKKGIVDPLYRPKWGFETPSEEEDIENFIEEFKEKKSSIFNNYIFYPNNSLKEQLKICNHHNTFDYDILTGWKNVILSHGINPSKWYMRVLELRNIYIIEL